MRPSVLLVVAHEFEAGFRECPQRARVAWLDARDARNRARAREHDVARERAQHLRTEAAADEILVADQEIDSRDALADLEDLLPLGIVRDEVRLDHPDGP